MAATQTKDAHDAATELLKFHDAADSNNVERYLQGLAVGSRPQEQVLTELVQLLDKKFEEPKVKDTLIQTISSMAYHFARLPNQSYKSKIVEKVQTYLTSSLKNCKDKECKEMYIRGLHNIQSPDTIRVLLAQVLNPERIVAVAAMKALRTFDTKLWTKDHQKQFENIFYQKTKKFDSSARTLAVDILLELKPGAGELRPLLQYLRTNDKAFEVKQYVLQKINMIADNCSRFKKLLKQIIAEDRQLNNYHILGQKGLTTALSRKFSKSPSFNGTLLSIQEIHGGVLKRGIVDMTVDAHPDKYSVFTVSAFFC